MCQPSALALWRQTGGDDKKGLKAQPRNVHALQRQSQGGATLNSSWNMYRSLGKVYCAQGCCGVGRVPRTRWEMRIDSKYSEGWYIMSCHDHIMIISLSYHVSIISCHYHIIWIWYTKTVLKKENRDIRRLEQEWRIKPCDRLKSPHSCLGLPIN